ncbi:MAG: MBL fold metallo-hydrolase [Deltaproteobacteria bacterium]|nr:MBL fold metallo-hydrolase [Deltaproteobacteria bacterium]
MKGRLDLSTHGDVRVLRLSTRVSRLVGYSVCCFQWDDVLVDSGFLHAWNVFEPHLRRHPVRLLLHTHSHEDHAGNSAAVMRLTGAKAPAPANLVDDLEHLERDHYRWFRKITWGAPPEPCPATVLDGDLVKWGCRRFRYIATPGHCSSHHVVFEETTRMVFTGDLYLAPVIRFASRHEELDQTLASLHRVADLEPEVMFDSHLGPLREPSKLLRERARNMEDVRQRILDLHAQGLSPRVIARRLFGPENHLRLITGGDFKKQNVVWSFLKGAGKG